MAPPSRGPRSGGGAGVLPTLPLDAVYEILLRLTAKDLCRLRAVSRPWRALLSDPHLAAAHAARHPAPLIVAGYGQRSGYPDGNVLCDIMDLSGRLVVRGTSNGGRWFLDPATGAVTVSPEEFADEHAAHQMDIYMYMTEVMLGKVAPTGEYKALRVFDKMRTPYRPSSVQLCEVFTLDGSSDARWRAKRAPPNPVDVYCNKMTVVNGVVYFFVNDGNRHNYVKPKYIASFPVFRFEGSSFGLPSNHMDLNNLSLASLNDCLAVVHCMRWAYIDIWFLTDFEKGLWARQHSIQIKQNVPDDGFHVQPLLVLNDGRIVTYTGTKGLLRIYNPRTTDFTDLATTRPCVYVFVYWKSIELTKRCQLIRQNVLLCAVPAVTLIQMIPYPHHLICRLKHNQAIYYIHSSGVEILRRLNVS